MSPTGSALFVFERGHEGAAMQVWPSLGDETSAVAEAKEYIFELRGVEDVWNVDLLIDDVAAEALRPRDQHTARWAWSPGFYAGGVDVSIRSRGSASVRFELVTDPDVRKLTRDNFDTMVREVLEDTFALFALSSHRFGIARGTGQSPPIARLEFLRSRLGELERVIRRIDGRPIRILSVDEEWLPLHKARTLTGPELERSLRNGKLAGMAPLPNRASTAPKLPFPNRVRKSIKKVDLNIREHQQIKWALRVWEEWLAAVADRLSIHESDQLEQRTSREAWAVRCKQMSQRIRVLLQLPLFEDVADRPGPILLSSVYRRSPAYTEFYSLYRDFNLGIAQVVGDFLQMPLTRTFDLYELWCFLRILRAAADKFELNSGAVDSVFVPTKDGGVTIPSSFVHVDLGHGFALAFQREYREFWVEKDKKGSFSRHMRPDIAVTAEGPSSLVVLDAKYRVESQLNDAIGDIHTYRDALVEPEGDSGVKRIVTAAYILTPFIAESGPDWKNLELRNRIFHPVYRTSFKFGAATLRPGMSITDVWDVLKQILDDAGMPTPTQ